MAVTYSELEKILKAAFPGDEIVINRDNDERYSVEVTSTKFAGHSVVKQHRMVYEALRGTDIHALQVKTCVK